MNSRSNLPKGGDFSIFLMSLDYHILNVMVKCKWFCLSIEFLAIFLIHLLLTISCFQSLVRLLEACAGNKPYHSLILFQDLLVSTTLPPVWINSCLIFLLLYLYHIRVYVPCTCLNLFNKIRIN